MRTWLLDTGPLVAYFDRGDVAHEAVTRCLSSQRGRSCTTGAVIGEAMRFLAEVAEGPEKLVEFVLASGLEVFECTQPPQIRAAVALMRRYSDTPMDFADATLVLLAQQLGTSEILTLDRRGFRTYRTSDQRSFRLILG